MAKKETKKGKDEKGGEAVRKWGSVNILNKRRKKKKS